ncbi:hypothetical protein, conserved [Eimeria necatrix]|uniref:Uncharacterized protein n=1 Tax=Eimeria necatrix TaxID=51315 RepID=U6N4P8_9EIME|nr:hypothetical protein, conserved [Eimeria necatrix]CDJ69680.1 hypothetical protein, conserved [Eimeria necatrix]
MLHNPHVESVKDIYFAKDFRAIVFTGIQLAVDLRAAGDAFEKALRLRDQHMLPSLLVVRNVPAVRMERDGSLSPCGYVTVRKHKAFRWIVSLAPSNARAYDVFDMVEGLELGNCSGLFVIGTWILDLRTFSALKMLFRSDLRNSRTTPPEYLFEAAFEAFGGVLGQQEGDDGLEDPLELGRPEEVTGSTALPVSSEGTQERGTPSSLPEAEPSDEEEGNKLPEHACDALPGSPLKQSLSLEDQQQERFEEDTTLSAASMKANEATHSRGKHPRLSAGSCFQDREHSAVAPKPFYEDSGSHAAMKHDEHIDSCPKREPVSILQNGETRCRLPTDAPYKDLSVQFPQSEQWLERPKDMQAASTLSREETREDDQHTPIAVKAEKAECLRNNNTSHRCLTTTTSDVHDEFETRTNSFGDHSAEKPGTDENNQVGVAKANDGETPPLETSTAAKATFDEVIEKQLRSWMAVNSVKYCGHKSSALVERCYPSHEFEYWAVEEDI